MIWISGTALSGCLISCCTTGGIDMRMMRCSVRPIAPDTPNYAQNAQRYVVPSYIMLGVRGASNSNSLSG